MVNHICSICLKIFTRKNDLERHQNKKNKCISNDFEHNNLSIDFHQNATKTTKNIKTPPKMPPKSTDYITINNIDDNHNKCIKCNKKFTRADSYNCLNLI
jgi:hypothetical protein